MALSDALRAQAIEALDDGDWDAYFHLRELADEYERRARNHNQGEQT